MKEYKFIELETDWGEWNPFTGVGIDTQGHREIIRAQAADGWEYAGWVPSSQRGEGYIERIDLIFAREVEG